MLAPPWQDLEDGWQPRAMRLPKPRVRAIPVGHRLPGIRQDRQSVLDRNCRAGFRSQQKGGRAGQHAKDTLTMSRDAAVSSTSSTGGHISSS
eukprot:5245900-Alexandrium_andersonii.AAC.1